MSNPDSPRSFNPTANRMKLQEKMLLVPEIEGMLNALADVKAPILVDLPCRRLPAKLPDTVDDWDPPYASYRYDMEIWFTRWFYRGLGIVMLLIGAMMLIGGVLVWFIPPRNNNQREDPLFVLAMMLLFGGGFFAGGLWFFWWRAPAGTRTIWIFKEGIVVRKAGVLEVHPWFHVGEIRCTLGPASAFATIRIFSETYTIGGRSESHRELIEFIEHRASAEHLPRQLRQLSDGRALNFGACYLHRKAFDFIRARHHWIAVEKVEASDQEFVVTFANRGPIRLPHDRVLFPSLCLTLARALTIYWRQAGEGDDLRDERDAPEPPDLPPDEPPDTRITR